MIQYGTYLVTNVIILLFLVISYSSVLKNTQESFHKKMNHFEKILHSEIFNLNKKILFSGALCYKTKVGINLNCFLLISTMNIPLCGRLFLKKSFK